MRGVTLFFSALLLGISGSPHLASATASAADTINVAIYRGEAGCKGCSEAAKSAIERADPRFRVTLVGPGERTDISRQTLARFDLYIQPGGGQDIPGALKALGSSRIDAIHDYVVAGGRYLGLCMGAYLASDYGLGLVAQNLESEVGRQGFPINGIDDTVAQLRWDGRAMTIFYQDGPYMALAERDQGFEAIAAYQNGDLAAARYTLGKGVVVLSGPHPEAPQSWFEDAELPLKLMPGDGPFKSLLRRLSLPKSRG